MLISYSSVSSAAISFRTSGFAVFFDDVPQFLIVQCQVCIHLLQFAVLLLELLQALHLAHIHSAILRLSLPLIKRCHRDTMLSGHQFCGYAAFQLTDGIHHLRLAVSGLLHMTKLIVYVYFHSVRLLGVATLHEQVHRAHSTR